MYGRKTTWRIEYKLSNLHQAAILHANHDPSWGAAKLCISDLSWSEIPILQGLCQDLLHPCEPRLRARKKQPGWRNLPSYLSLVPAFPFYQLPPIVNSNESQRPFPWNLISYARARTTCWNCGRPTTQWEAHSQAFSAFKNSGSRISE